MLFRSLIGLGGSGFRSRSNFGFLHRSKCSAGKKIMLDIIKEAEEKATIDKIPFPQEWEEWKALSLEWADNPVPEAWEDNRIHIPESQGSFPKVKIHETYIVEVLSLFFLLFANDGSSRVGLSSGVYEAIVSGSTDCHCGNAANFLAIAKKIQNEIFSNTLHGPKVDGGLESVTTHLRNVPGLEDVDIKYVYIYTSENLWAEKSGLVVNSKLSALPDGDGKNAGLIVQRSDANGTIVATRKERSFIATQHSSIAGGTSVRFAGSIFAPGKLEEKHSRQVLIPQTGHYRVFEEDQLLSAQQFINYLQPFLTDLCRSNTGICEKLDVCWYKISDSEWTSCSFTTYKDNRDKAIFIPVLNHLVITQNFSSSSPNSVLEALDNPMCHTPNMEKEKVAQLLDSLHHNNNSEDVDSKPSQCFLVWLFWWFVEKMSNLFSRPS